MILAEEMTANGINIAFCMMVCGALFFGWLIFKDLKDK